MKRSAPLRRTAMRRTSTILRAVPLNPVSKRRAKLNRQRKVVVDHVRAVQDWCSRCGRTGVGLDAHELVRRSQWRAGLVELENIVLLDRECHRWVTENPREAHEEGWVIWSWER